MKPFSAALSVCGKCLHSQFALGEAISTLFHEALVSTVFILKPQWPHSLGSNAFYFSKMKRKSRKLGHPPGFRDGGRNCWHQHILGGRGPGSGHCSDLVPAPRLLAVGAALFGCPVLHPCPRQPAATAPCSGAGFQTHVASSTGHPPIPIPVSPAASSRAPSELWLLRGDRIRHQRQEPPFPAPTCP